MEVSQDNIKLARFLAGAIGFEPNVYPYYDDGESHQIDILSLKDPIDELVGIYSSIGLSDYENLVAVSDGKNNIPIELMMTAYTRFESATNILSTCCFYIIKDKFECRPGAVFMRMVEFYIKDSPMKHIYFTSPFLWQEKLDQLHLDSKHVAFLLCIPISDRELQYKLEHGDDALESLFQDNEINIYDLYRESVL